MCAWLGSPGESAAARIPERYISSQFFAVLSDFPPFDFSLPCVNPPPQYLWPQPYSSWHESPFSVFEWLLCIGVCKAGLTHVIPSTWKFRLSGKFSLEKLYESAGSLDFFFPFSIELCRPQISNFFVLSTNNLLFLVSVKYTPVFMQGKSNF